MRYVRGFICAIVLLFIHPAVWSEASLKPGNAAYLANPIASLEAEGGLAWPEYPSSEDIFSLPIFPEPLVPLGQAPTPEDNQGLLAALKRFQQRTTIEDVSPLTDYLVQHPNSPWRVALLSNLGNLYYQSGYFSKALDTWEAVWQAGKDEKNPAGKALVDHAVGELARMHARIGHVERLKVLLKELDGRTLTGSATEYVVGAREGLWRMEHEPGTSFLCGSKALGNVARALNRQGVDMAAIDNARSGPRGFSLQEVQDLAKAAKLPYRMAKRKPDAALPLPAVAHWKVSHYAALVGEQNGLYHLKDPTFGEDLWISKAALEHETSGYYLIAANGKLPEGWEPVSGDEAKTIRGMGNTGSGCPTCTGSDSNSDGGDDSSCPMAGYDFLTMTASLRVSDTPIQYTPALGPKINFRVTYIHREAGQPANFNFSNLGRKWTHNWLAYVEDTPSNPSADVILHRAGGGSDVFTGYDTVTRQFALNPKYQDILRRSQNNPAVYRRLLADGGQEVYAQNGPSAGATRQVFLSQVIDPQGNAVKLGYDAKRRLVSLTDATGNMTKLAYNDATDAYKITRVTDPAGRFAAFAYQYADYAGNPCDPKQAGCKADKLSAITDPAGIVSSFRYNYGSDFMNTLTTPYGSTRFDFGESYNGATGPRRWLMATDPLGHRERLDYLHNAYGIASFDPSGLVPQGMGTVNQYLNYRNSFYWDKNATAQACRFGANTQCDYTKAKLMHWLHGSGSGFNITQDVLESEKMPLENRVWYNYPGQDPNDSNGFVHVGSLDQPSAVGRVLDDGTTQLSQYAYNAKGLPTQATDPLSRTRFYEYAANQIDVLRIWQKAQDSCDVPGGVKKGCDLIAEYKYNSQHRPLSYKDAAGKTTQYTYNDFGQLTKIINPLGEASQFAYIEKTADPNYRRLAKISRAGKTLASFSYDAAGRVKTATDAGGFKRSFAYDDLDRLVKITYPDGTSDARAYALHKLDLKSETDRLGRTTQYAYNAIRQLTQIIYPKNPGDPDRIVKLDWCGCGALNSLIDPEGQVTRWSHDLQARTTGKFYPGNRSAIPDEAYGYENATSRLRQVFSQNNPGPALVTEYSYDADDQLHSINYDVAVVKPKATPAVSFQYDSVYPRLTAMTDGLGETRYSYYPPGVLGAGQLKDENGPWKNDTLHYSYDALGRQSSRAIDGKGQRQFAYDALARLAGETNPLGKFSYGYLGATPQLSEIATLLPSSQPGLRSVFSYADNLRDRRLQRLQHRFGKAQTVLASYGYDYDTVGNITRWSQQQKGQPLFEADYQYDAIDQLTEVIPVGSAAGSHYLFDYDLAGNRVEAAVDGQSVAETSNELNQLIQRGAGGSYQYDGDGNRITDSAKHRQYAWDGAGRLLSIADANAPGKHSDFSYDGLGRLRVIKEYQNAAVKSEKRYLWCGLERCEERSQSNAVLKRYFSQGEARGVTALYYSRDHLGSVRELTNAAGAVQAQYRYDPWGQVTKLAGNLDGDFRYTGHYYHAPSSLHLAPFRAYEAGTGRWLSRDPMFLSGGDVNLYAYVLNDPANAIDLLGLQGSSTYTQNVPAGQTQQTPAGNIVTTTPGGGAIVQTPSGQTILLSPNSSHVIGGESINTRSNGGQGQSGTAGTGDGSSSSSSARGKVIWHEPPYDKPKPTQEPKREKKVSCKIVGMGGQKTDGPSFPDLTGE